MNRYLAKSDPEEDIQKHTDNLIKNYKLLEKTYPGLEINWDMLYKACLYHDFGKMNLKFQRKIETHKKISGEIPHGILSLVFIDFEELEESGYTNDDIRVLFHSIAYHHERALEYSEDELNEEIKKLKYEYENFKYDKIDKRFISDYIEADFFIAKDRIYEERDKNIFFDYVMIKGLLNRIDYAASGDIPIENKNDFLGNSLEELLNSWRMKKPESKWNELQEYMIKNRDKNVVVIAQTGMGKTEAGLLWIDNNKGFFTLPLKTAINAIYDRVLELVKVNKDARVGLLHSDTLSEYIDDEDGGIDLLDYFNKTKQLSLPLTICTLDQIFDFVYKYRGFEPKLATLSYSKLVIDEIQMYSPDLLAYLIIGLSYINKVGGKFAILTATLPSFILNLLEEQNVSFEKAEKPFINKELNNRHSLKVIDEEVDIDKIVELYNKNKVLVICNTVDKAQEVYEKLVESELENINLFHSRFIKKDRKEKEESILKMGNRKSKYYSESYGIWVTTQVVEASLDIDFDILVTELSDINGLFQRLGRCYRSRNFITDGYNCYVYTGGDKKCSGVGYVIDEKIFDFSKEAIKDICGVLTEEKKIEIIDYVYSYEKLNGTEYLKSVREAISFVKNIKEYDTSKSEVKKMFRNIDSTTVIPKPIYEENSKEIDGYIKIMQTKIAKGLSKEDKNKEIVKKTKARDNLMKFIVSVRTDKTIGRKSQELDISKYEKIPVLDCEYSELIGVKIDQKKQESSYEFI